MHSLYRKWSFKWQSGVQPWAVLYPKPYCNEPCYKEVQLYIHIPNSKTCQLFYLSRQVRLTWKPSHQNRVSYDIAPHGFFAEKHSIASKAMHFRKKILGICPQILLREWTAVRIMNIPLNIFASINIFTLSTLTTVSSDKNNRGHSCSNEC